MMCSRRRARIPGDGFNEYPNKKQTPNIDGPIRLDVSLKCYVLFCKKENYDEAPQ